MLSKGGLGCKGGIVGMGYKGVKGFQVSNVGKGGESIVLIVIC